MEKNATKESWLQIVAIVAVATSMTFNGCGGESRSVPGEADPAQGRQYAEQLGCGSCHRIPGIASARGTVGPPLEHIAQRAYLAGVLPNTFDNMVQWLARPQHIAPGSAMPSVEMTKSEARDIAAYLYTLD